MREMQLSNTLRQTGKGLRKHGDSRKRDNHGRDIGSEVLVGWMEGWTGGMLASWLISISLA